jgi:hypothetical protein
MGVQTPSFLDYEELKHCHKYMNFKLQIITVIKKKFLFTHIDLFMVYLTTLFIS